MYHCLEDCFSIYRDFFNLQTIFFPFTLKTSAGLIKMFSSNCPLINFKTSNCFMIGGWFEWVNFFYYLEYIRDDTIKVISFKCFDFPLRLPKCWSFRLSYKVIIRQVRLLNRFKLMFLGLRLMILISVIKSFKMLLITRIFYCGGFKLHLRSDIFCLAWILYRLRMQYRKFIEWNIFTHNDLSF